MRCHAFVLEGWIVHDLFCNVAADPTGNGGRWLGGCGSVLRSTLHLSHFSVAIGVAVSEVRVFLWLEIRQFILVTSLGHVFFLGTLTSKFSLSKDPISCDL